MRLTLVLLFMVFMAKMSFAQEDPINSQYMTNPLAINPSYAGIHNVANFNFDSRFQWTSLEGSPTTYTFTGNTSIVNGKVGLGLMVLNDKIGIANNTEVQVSYAYKIGDAKKTFSFGLQTGFMSYSTNDEQLNLRYANDPLFQPGLDNATKFNVGAGATYMDERLFISVSVPRMLNSKIGDSQEITAYERHFYLVGQYLFDFKPGFKMKPSILARAVAGAPVSVDVNLTFLINNVFWAGAFTRNFETYGILLQFDFLEAYKLGYSFEVLSNKFAGNQLLTHEIILSADIAIFSHQDVYRRFF